MQERLEHGAEKLLPYGIAVIGDNQAATMAAGKIGEHGGGIRQMNMHDVGPGIADFRDHSRAQWRGEQVQPRGNSRDRHIFQDFCRCPVIVAGHNHTQIERFSQLGAERLQVSLDAAHMRRIELSHVKRLEFARAGAARLRRHGIGSRHLRIPAIHAITAASCANSPLFSQTQS